MITGSLDVSPTTGTTGRSTGELVPYGGDERWLPILFGPRKECGDDGRLILTAFGYAQ